MNLYNAIRFISYRYWYNVLEYICIIWVQFIGGSVMRISTKGSTPQGLTRPKEVSAMTRPIIQKILEDPDVLPKV
jgi:hypothetical protein